ncbi:MAG: nuclear transport factor 2 family protein [Proteobacteria bacterium]|nr:nuclear transport factor 2 family protein [Pseudomonadota bacterium]
MAQADETVSDYDLIKTTIGHYFDGLRLADRARLERAFAVEYAHMKGYIKDANGKLVESSRAMNEVIDEWVAREPNPALKGSIVSINIYSDIAAQATFDFNGVYTDAFQLAKINGEWRIMSKFYVNQ